MSTDTTALTPRQRLIDTLCNDLNFQGWDQPNKMWYVKGDVSDEWLEFAGQFSGAPENHLVDTIAKNAGTEGVTGVVVSSEGWAYPKKLAESFKSESALRAYWRLTPPSDHPEKVEIRHLLLVSQDGEVIGLTAHHDAEGTKQWARLDASTPCPTGDRVVDAGRALLGLNDALKQRVLSAQSGGQNISGDIAELRSILDAMKSVIDGNMTTPEATLKLFYSVPEDVRRQMISQMPEFLKDEMRKLLPPDEAPKYGL